MSVRATYTKADGATVTLELQGDPFEICNAVRERLFPGVLLAAQDPKFDALMAARDTTAASAARSQ